MNHAKLFYAINDINYKIDESFIFKFYKNSVNKENMTIFTVIIKLQGVERFNEAQ